MKRSPNRALHQTSRHLGNPFRIQRALRFFSVLLFFFLPLALLAQTKTLSPEKRAQISKAVSSFMAANSVPGLSVSVVLDNDLAWSEGFGMADLENFVPASNFTLFRLGSISKSITAVAILQLYERGKLDLDAEVQKYCPAFPKKEAPITSRQLLGHLAGIRHYNPDGKGDVPEDSARHFSSMEASLQLFANDPLVEKPGVKFHYSTYGYTVLGCVLEGASSQRFVDYVRANVLDPAGMHETRDDNDFTIVQHRTRFYHLDKSGAVQNAGVLDSSYKIPGGGFISSADDMARFAIAVLNGKLLKPATRELMWTSQKNADGSLTAYGMGWFVSNKNNLFLAGHSGGQQGTSTDMLLVPDRRTAVLVLANRDNVNDDRLARQVLQILLDLPSLPE